ncbi:GNAT family N-acetyltransferase [Bacillus sp. PS06]|uniref:GNAT family N-acetyltransferase n=1 Tax=Bacillus sp. PS06 TaxID=2764176 RepID=UPI00177FB684|nr:GNAT family N-acetyltransferase [Bacillus sp. PS06]MBD8070189.1 GNAT family N-acetyltransferase [Bacillus sp. PS06]
MEQTKSKIEIVEYHEGLAKGVAEMWNLSRDGWGGDSHVTTEEKVLVQEANSGNLNLYLAMDGDKVVGYCGLCEYREDEGALYIPLLNVRTDYHGQKIGKLLVLKALERTVELNWPRLDLYTWAGNTKAVPLYKKCGFFWEDRDDTTHLMNFMPTVLNTEAAEEYFAIVNWYDASTRIIEVTPDGKKENEFTFYEYKWNSNGNQLKMEFERTGRGLRTIETNDYIVSASVENFKLVSDAEYKIHYYVKNKSGKPLQIALEGVDHQIVEYSFTDSFTVETENSIEATFKINTLVEEQSNWRTHPSVITNVLINGKKAIFKTGILPKLPAQISAFVPNSQCYLNEEAVFYLDLENNFNETTTYNVSIPSCDLVELKQSVFNVSLEPKEKTSIAIPYRLNQFGFYAPNIEVDVKRENGQTQQFTKQIGLGFKGLGARFYGECDDYWQIYNGLYHLYLSKFDNKIIPGRLTKGSQQTMGMFPKIGKPYSSEFSKRKPYKIEHKLEGNAVILHAFYKSTAFPQLELVSVSKLYSEGLVEQSYTIRNLTDRVTAEPISIYQPVYHELYKPVMVVNGDVIKVEDKANSEYGLWNSRELTENWLFSRYEAYPQGISWPKDAKVNFESWYFYVEHELGLLQANSEYSTKPVYYSIGAYQSFDDFREFSMRKQLDSSISYEDIQLTHHDSQVKLMDRKISYIQGEVSFNMNTPIHLTLDDEKREVNVEIENTLTPVSTIKAEYEINGIKDHKINLQLNPTKELVKVNKVIKLGRECLVASNEQITMTASDEFYPTLTSLEIGGKEWLDTSFPTLGPKSWWNPWSGGIRSSLLGINQKSFTKERSSVSEGVLIDDTGRVWKGLKISTVFSENETYKGLGLHQYFCMLPGIPIVVIVTKIEQNSGTYFHYKKWFTEGCFKHGWMQNVGENRKFIAGKSELMTYLSEHIVMGTSDDNQLLQYISDREATEIESYMNKEVMSLATWREIQMADGTERLSAPSFIVGTNKMLSADEAKDLQRMRFKEVSK